MIFIITLLQVFTLVLIMALPTPPRHIHIVWFLVVLTEYVVSAVLTESVVSSSINCICGF